MTTVALIFDLPDDVLNQTHDALSSEEIIQLAIKCWLENHTPLFYSARLTRKDIIAFVAEDVAGKDEEAVELLYSKLISAVEAIDRYMSHVLTPHKLAILEKTRWLGSSCVVQVNQPA